jgi:hypothetical protein
MAHLTRRALIKRGALGVGATGALAAAVATGIHIGSSVPANAQVSQSALAAAGEPLVVCINDATSGTLVLMRGENEITVQNPELVRSLLAL